MQQAWWPCHRVRVRPTHNSYTTQLLWRQRATLIVQSRVGGGVSQITCQCVQQASPELSSHVM